MSQWKHELQQGLSSHLLLWHPLVNQTLVLTGQAARACFKSDGILQYRH